MRVAAILMSLGVMSSKEPHATLAAPCQLTRPERTSPFQSIAKCAAVGPERRVVDALAQLPEMDCSPPSHEQPTESGSSEKPIGSSAPMPVVIVSMASVRPLSAAAHEMVNRHVPAQASGARKS